MLPLRQRYAFLLFAAITLVIGARGFYRLYLHIRRGRGDAESRTDRFPARLWYAIVTSLSQSRTFRKRTAVSFFHSFIFYGFVFYLLVNLADAIEGFVPFAISSATTPGAIYNFVADILSLLVLIGVIALVVRRFLIPARHDFRFNEKTLLHPDIQHGYITRDSIIVSAFILFHVGSRAIGAGARIAADGPDRWQPFATALSHLFDAQNAEAWRVFGYWGALGSVLVFLAYFPYTKHVHIFMAPANYLLARRQPSGVLPLVEINLEVEDQQIGAKRLEDLAWPRLLDAYACIQCNRCQDVCPATATGKSLSPAALEINKRMELNRLSKQSSGAESPQPLLQFALTPEAAWACTTCGACMEVCPVQDEQMLDIIDIRRNQVMMEGEFPMQLQSAFRGMERAKNPWGINHDRRMQWAEGLDVKTTEENPAPDLLYWVGCAASYDPQAQKTARAFVQLLNHAKVNYAVLGKKECCTGDSARRAGNEHLYRELADQNVATLNAARPKLIVASCPHCMNAIGKEYSQIGGDYPVMHHSEYLASLVANGKLASDPLDASITYHDPCYLGRHNGVYEAPRNLLHVLSNDVRELDRNRENSFCCGAGGAQFWKEEEAGSERISENRFREVKQRLADAGQQKTLAVGCPFCKSMLNSTPGKGDADEIVVKDIAELLLEGVQKKAGIASVALIEAAPSSANIDVETAPAILQEEPVVAEQSAANPIAANEIPLPAETVQRKKWQPNARTTAPTQVEPAAKTEAQAPPAGALTPSTASAPPPLLARKKWTPKASATSPENGPTTPIADAASLENKADEGAKAEPEPSTQPPERKKWQPKSKNPQA
ncbi:Fe-S oxidoreductase [Silvibacterium bohemicum]|uniref:Fe-S oxidoreductase n=1 Tax=Silvibacterium bohemicum TaxID=1577686 RepID=A0A841JVS8_9BACT|nr:heterodisulfide reductase-related iron-sulfur binding cluster [Silvibacterium bohemicum]MBB6144645.1 Fe-S oxidoreductase [Silvibacterium bohemicum]